jgi:hypothetical protein
MKSSTLYLALAIAAVATGGAAGFASAQNDTQDESPDASSDQAYSSHWFSPTGYGPNDTQIEETRALNNEQLENAGQMPNPALDSMTPPNDDQGDDQPDAPSGATTTMQPEPQPAPGTTY